MDGLCDGLEKRIEIEQWENLNEETVPFIRQMDGDEDSYSVYHFI